MGREMIVRILMLLFPTNIYWKSPKNDDEVAALLLAVDDVWLVLVVVFIVELVVWVILESLLVSCNAKISDDVNNLWLLLIED